jgi:hypothetical protein
MIHEEGRRSACNWICFGDLNVEVFFLNLQEFEILELVIRTRSGREEDVNKNVNWVVE